MDGQSKVWQTVPASVYASLIYDRQNLDKVIELLQPYSKDLNTLWQRSSYGLDEEFKEIVKKLSLLVLDGFDRLPKCFGDGEAKKALRIFLENFTLKGKSPADDLIARYKLADKFDASDIAAVENEWEKLFI